MEQMNNDLENVFVIETKESEKVNGWKNGWSVAIIRPAGE